MFALSHNYLALLVGKAPAELGVRILPLGEPAPESAGRNTGEDFGQSDLLPAM